MGSACSRQRAYNHTIYYLELCSFICRRVYNTEYKPANGGLGLSRRPLCTYSAGGPGPEIPIAAEVAAGTSLSVEVVASH